MYINVHGHQIFAKCTLNECTKMELDPPLYLDQFTDCLEGLLDGIDLLYGAQVTLSLHNIQPLLKFSLLYKVEGVLKVCLEWINKELSMVNLFTFCKVGLFVRSVDCEDVLRSCKEFIMTSSADELLDVSKGWSEDENVINFLLDKEMLSVTLPTVTNWVSNESKVVMVLDRIEECGLEEEMAKLRNPNESLNMMAKMHDLCETVPNLKHVYKIQSYITSKCQLTLKPLVQLVLPDYSLNLLKSLKPKLWRSYDCEQVMLLYRQYQLKSVYFAEIALDWICFTNPSKEDLTLMWGVLKNLKISESYLSELRSSVESYNAEHVIPRSEESAIVDDIYMSVYSDNSAVIQTILANTGTDRTVHMMADCSIKSCTIGTKHATTFTLSDTLPCYQLGLEGGTGHYHHDKLQHWFTTEEKYGKRVLLSFVTNTMAEVIDKVKVSENIHLHNLLLV